MPATKRSELVASVSVDAMQPGKVSRPAGQAVRKRSYPNTALCLSLPSGG